MINLVISGRGLGGNGAAVSGATTPSIDVATGVLPGESTGLTVDLRWAATTHRGLRRPTNQDCYRIFGPVFVVCDGMGGERGGELASGLVADSVATLGGLDHLTFNDFVRGVSEANCALVEAARSDIGFRGMGSTVVALALCDVDGRQQIAGLNVGDSRAYISESGDLTQMSHDHSVVQELIDAGSITAKDAQTHRERSVLTSVIGMDKTPAPFTWRTSARPGTRFLMCTDGIHRTMGHPVLERLVNFGGPEESVVELVSEAFRQHAPDNVALIVIDVVGPGQDAHDDADITVERPRRQVDSG